MSSATNLPPPFLFILHRNKAGISLVRYIKSRGIQLIHTKKLAHSPNTQSQGLHSNFEIGGGGGGHR